MATRGLGEANLKEKVQRPRRTVVAALQETARDPVGVDAIPVADIVANPDNPPSRSTTNIDELAASIGEVGVLSPLTVVPAGEWLSHHAQHVDQVGSADWVCLAGHRRLAASRQAGIAVVPVIVRADLAGVDSVVLHENIQRLALTPIQEATSYRRLVSAGMSQRELARHLGVSQGQVSKRLSLLTLPEVLQARVTAGTLEIGDALSLLTRPGVEALLEIERVSPDQLVDSSIYGIRQIAYRIARERDEAAAAQAAAAAAAAENIEVVPYDYSVTPLTLKKEIDAARADGDLVVSAHAARSEGEGPVLLYSRASERTTTTTSRAAETESRRQREERAARKGRWDGLVSLAEAKPQREELRVALVEHAISGRNLNSLSAGIARKIVDATIGRSASSDHFATAAYWPTWLAATKAALSAPEREHLAWIVILATQEQGVRDSGSHGAWGPELLGYLDLLEARTSWHPTSWEARDLTKARAQAAGDREDEPS